MLSASFWSGELADLKYCLSFVCHSVAIHHSYWKPTILQNRWYKSSWGILCYIFLRWNLSATGKGSRDSSHLCEKYFWCFNIVRSYRKRFGYISKLPIFKKKDSPTPVCELQVSLSASAKRREWCEVGWVPVPPCQVGRHILTAFNTILLLVCITQTVNKYQLEKWHVPNLRLPGHAEYTFKNRWDVQPWGIFTYLWRCVDLCLCPDHRQEYADGWVARITPPVDSELGARMLVIT